MKLNKRKVKQIREDRRAGMKLKDIASKFDISLPYVFQIAKNKARYDGTFKPIKHISLDVDFCFRMRQQNKSFPEIAKMEQIHSKRSKALSRETVRKALKKFEKEEG